MEIKGKVLKNGMKSGIFLKEQQVGQTAKHFIISGGTSEIVQV